MTPREARACPLTREASALLADLYERQRLSGQAHDRALRLARTIADLEGTEAIGEEHLARALDMGRLRCTL
jgi:magnesium chelatase family protein